MVNQRNEIINKTELCNEVRNGFVQTSCDLSRVWAITGVQKSTRSFLSDPCVIYKQGSSVQQLYKIHHDKMPKSYLSNSYYRDLEKKIGILFVLSV